jgi:hypothetical protein
LATALPATPWAGGGGREASGAEANKLGIVALSEANADPDYLQGCADWTGEAS